MMHHYVAFFAPLGGVLVGTCASDILLLLLLLAKQINQLS